MKTKVLIATYYWPPSGGPGVQRYLKFSKYLPAFEVEPIILTVKNPTYPIQDPTLEQEIPERLRVFKTRTIEPFKLYAGLKGEKAESIKPTIELEGETFRSTIGSWIRANIFIPDARAGWLLTAKPKAEELAVEYGIDTVITTGPPHSVHFIGKHLQQKMKIRWLADFRDPWSQVYYNQLLPRTSVAEQVDEKMEKSVLSSADEIIVVSRSQAESFRKIVERGYRVITNGFDPDDFKDLKPVDRSESGTLIRHIGNIGEAAVPEAFLRAIKSVSDTINLTVEFIGDNHPDLQKLVHKYKLHEIVSIKEYQPHKIAIQKMADADILLLSIPDVEDIQHHIPGKLFEYIGTGRPILMLGPENGDSAEIIEQENSGIACGFNDLESIEKAIKILSARSLHDRSPIHTENHPYSRISLTKTLSDLILEKSG
jgi:glycosyltransferase involved in cell wall biosynthesis